MSDLRVELDAVVWLGVVGDGGEGSGLGTTHDMEVWWKGRELVAVRHPDLGSRMMGLGMTDC